MPRVSISTSPCQAIEGKSYQSYDDDQVSEEMTHPPTNYKVSHRRCFELQVWNYIRSLEDEPEIYRPMRWNR